MSDVAVRIVEQTIAPCLAIRLYLRIEDFVLSFGMFVSVLAQDDATVFKHFATGRFDYSYNVSSRLIHGGHPTRSCLVENKVK